jgi:hypothetical protein
MIIRTAQSEIDAYFEDNEHLSQSKIKQILKGMDVYNKEKDEKLLYYEEKGHFIIGSGVDVYLTQGVDVYNAQYHITTVDKPGDKTLSILTYLYDQIVNQYHDHEDGNSYINMLTLDVIEDDDILLVCNTEGFYPKWKDVTRVSKIKESHEYFNEICKAYGKQIIDPEEHEIIMNIVNSLMDNEQTKKYFPTIEMPNGIDIYYQYPLYFDYEGIPSKILLDAVYVDHNKKEIILIDLKTVGDVTIRFPYQAAKFRYDIQAAWYLNGFANSDLLTDEYDMKDFIFIVESTKVQGNPLIYESSFEFLRMGSVGRPEGTTPLSIPGELLTSIPHKAIHGFVEGCERYKWHLENGFEFDKIVVENNRTLELGWNRII